jgi:hypothetical protein
MLLDVWRTAGTYRRKCPRSGRRLVLVIITAGKLRPPARGALRASVERFGYRGRLPVPPQRARAGARRSDLPRVISSSRSGTSVREPPPHLSSDSGGVGRKRPSEAVLSPEHRAAEACDRAACSRRHGPERVVLTSSPLDHDSCASGETINRTETGKRRGGSSCDLHRFGRRSGPRFAPTRRSGPAKVKRRLVGSGSAPLLGAIACVARRPAACGTAPSLLPGRGGRDPPDPYFFYGPGRPPRAGRASGRWSAAWTALLPDIRPGSARASPRATDGTRRPTAATGLSRLDASRPAAGMKVHAWLGPRSRRRLAGGSSWRSLRAGANHASARPCRSDLRARSAPAWWLGCRRPPRPLSGPRRDRRRRPRDRLERETPATRACGGFRGAAAGAWASTAPLAPPGPRDGAACGRGQTAM